MSENYLMLNGKRIDLTEEQLKTLMAEEKKNPFERGEFEDRYFSIVSDGAVCSCEEEGLDLDNKRFATANYCTDRAMMEQRALHETLNRLLWRYSEEHGGDNKWDVKEKHYFIFNNMAYGSCVGCHCDNIDVYYNDMMHIDGVVYFKDEETAQSAINEVVNPFMAQHPEFVW